MSEADMIAVVRANSQRPTLKTLSKCAERARSGDGLAQRQVVAAQCWAAFSAPAGIESVYDALAAGWFGQASPTDDGLSGVPEVAIPDALWDALRAILADAEGFDAGTITARVAALGALTDPGFGELAEAAAAGHPKANDPVHQQVPPLIDVPSLADADAESLAGQLYHMLVENGYDAEVLDREAIGLAALPPALRYVNTRILQMHDVWHLAAGYRTTALHEIAISAFQLAQFGHNYSAMFLAAVGAISLHRSPEGYGLLMQTVLEAWQHGRQTPSLMAIDWEQHWRKPLDEVREDFSIAPFAGSFPADLLEQLNPAT
ncbi:MAG: Coq4 family protein [Pseudomonadota bacterium]